MDKLLLIIALALSACGLDTSSSPEYNNASGVDRGSNSRSDNIVVNSGGTYIGTNYGTVNISNGQTTNTTSTASTQRPSVFPTDLVYVGINKTSHGANLVMKNNTAYTMSVKVNYTISCSVNGKPAETTSRTLSFYFHMYEQIESTNSVDGYWHGGMTTIDCTGTIISIIPDYSDKSNFHAWTGSYLISTT